MKYIWEQEDFVLTDFLQYTFISPVTQAGSVNKG